MNDVWLIGDTHFSHVNLATKLRGFSSIHDHDEVLIDCWNGVVKKGDLVWHLGDVGMDRNRLNEILPRLNGTKKLVLGNHDKFASSFYLKHFSKVYGAVNLDRVLLTHIPVHPNEARWFKLNVHGHIHHKERCLDSKMYFNVNCDVVPRIWSPTPWEDVVRHIKFNQ